MLINLTPHAINIYSDPKGIGEVIVIANSDLLARVTQTRQQIGVSDDAPLFETTNGNVTGIPDPVPGTLYIVSALVRCALPNRRDLVSPGALIRDENGQPKGCYGLDVNS